jgi:hypothetical protein
LQSDTFSKTLRSPTQKQKCFQRRQKIPHFNRIFQCSKNQQTFLNKFNAFDEFKYELSKQSALLDTQTSAAIQSNKNREQAFPVICQLETMASNSSRESLYYISTIYRLQATTFFNGKSRKFSLSFSLFLNYPIDGIVLSRLRNK